jgi:thioredoxin reductase (NADPH)
LAREYDVIIAGAGVAGLTAGMYTARYGLRTAVIEPMMGGNQIINVEKIEDFPGFPQGISGAELVPLMLEQAMNAGAEFLMEEATGIVQDNPYKSIATTEGTYRAKAVIVAVGSSLKKLGISGEDKFYGNGVSHCASCDGPMYAGGVVGVVGGGDSATDEALTLTEYTDRVILFHRRDKLRAQKATQDRVLRHPKIDVAFNTVVESVVGGETVTGVQTRNVITNLADRIELSGVFVYVGLEPNTEFVRGLLKMDNAGHIPVDLWMETQVPGIFAAGDVRQHSASQLASAAGDGATAAIAAFRYITGRQWPRN